MARAINGLTATARAHGFKAGGYLPVSGIRWRMGNVHISTPALAIAREFWHQRAKQYPRSLKRAVVRVALREHQANRRLYWAVMRGTL